MINVVSVDEKVADDLIQIRHVVLEVVEDAAYRAVWILWSQRRETNVLYSHGVVVVFSGEVGDGVLQQKNLKNSLKCKNVNDVKLNI